jgi:PAS domain S-box-containing protein
MAEKVNIPHHELLEKEYRDMSADLKAIFELSYDVLYVSDHKGNTLRVSSACEKLWGKKAHELVGRNVRDLEKLGVYSPSITRLVLETGEKVSTIQTTSTGKRLMVVGTPIKNEQGEIIRVVNASKDITEISQLKNKIEEMKKLIEGYKQELKELRQETEKENKIIFQSRKMAQVLDLAKRVAEVDSTILILGESGSGKEVIANFIHQKSLRKDKPFIKINCGAIPDNLLESELFGYSKGAFTGASREGKMGLFELANQGTLFLDEIGEMPINLQVKLLRVIQEQEITRIGGIKPIKVNVRIITATNKNLEEEVKKGAFREDLFYRINVIPIQIPPIRERKEDILALTLHFIDIYNHKYIDSKTFSPALLETLCNYDWPGNVRELQNMVERLMVISDEPDITERFLPESIKNSKNQPPSKVKVYDVMPLKECVELVEHQLLHMAKERYHTTVKIAEALGVNQSTISRKLNKLE